ncbi:hypothetical protein ACFQ38_12000 [Sporosarcina contaminans]|uniref:Uncharacterized protein n=1 Tax=Sporosarcina contaminans TaxID=633403 RepID=A0ABW3TZ85_9BACL
MKEKFIVRIYMTPPNNMQDDMNGLAEQGYRPKEIKVEKYQNFVEGVIIYELEGESHDN